MAISIWAVISEEVITLQNGKPYISRQTEQVAFAGAWTLEGALAHAKREYPEAISYTIGESGGGGCVAGDLSAGQ